MILLKPEEIKDRLDRNGKIENCYCNDFLYLPEIENAVFNKTVIATCGRKNIAKDEGGEIQLWEYVYVQEQKKRTPWTLGALDEIGIPFAVRNKGKTYTVVKSGNDIVTIYFEARSMRAYNLHGIMDSFEFIILITEAGYKILPTYQEA